MANGKLTLNSAQKRADAFIKRIPAYPGNFDGRGIIIPAGGLKYFANAWVALRMLRKLGCALPIQIWHLGATEIDDRMRAMTLPYDVEFIDAHQIIGSRQIKKLGGWEVKPFAILNSRFKEVLLLDADNIPVVNPEFLFATSQFRETGAIFWPDFGHLKPSDPIWDICGVPYSDEPEWESGQIIVDKEKCWQSLQLAMWYNKHSDFFYQYILGDKDTYHMAFRKLKQPFAMPATPVKALKCTLCQHDFNGDRIFQHRVNDKWSIERENEHIWDFQHESACRTFLEELQAIWFGQKQRTPRFDNGKRSPKENEQVREIVENVFHYERIGFDGRPMTFDLNGHIKQGAGINETYWDLKREGNGEVLLLSSKTSLTCSLRRQQTGIWKGRWLIGEGMPVMLKPASRKMTYSEKRSAKTARIRVQARVTNELHPQFKQHVVPILESSGFNVAISSTSKLGSSSSINTGIRFPKRMLWMQSPTPSPRVPKDALWFTYWSMLPFSVKTLKRLNQTLNGIVVPSEWDASCLSCAGINKPIWIIPFGIDNAIYHYSPMEMTGPCVFGLVDDSPNSRNHIANLVECFTNAFPQTTDVFLRIYSPNIERQTPKDPRVQIIQNTLTEHQLASWLQRLTCFISLGSSIAWSMYEHKALSIGRPLLGTRWGRIADLVSTDVGYPVEFRIQRDESFINWMEPDWDHVISQMQSVYMNRPLASQMGINGPRKTSAFTWKQFSRRLKQILTATN